MKSFAEYITEVANTQKRYCPKCSIDKNHKVAHTKVYDYDFDAPDYDENAPPKVFMKCKGCGTKTEVKIRGKYMKEDLTEENKYDYEWDHPTLTYHVTKNGQRIDGASYKAKSQFDRSAADEAAKKHARKLKSDEVIADRKAKEHSYQYDKPLSEVEKRWVEMHKRLVAGAKKKGPGLDDKEVEKYLSFGQAVRKSLRDGTHPALKEEVELEEMARPKKMIADNTSTGVLDAKGLVDTIGKTRADKVFNHPWHKKHIVSDYPHKTGYKVSTDQHGFPTVSASSTFTFDYKGKTIRKMVQFPMAKHSNKVYNAHVYHNYDNEKHRPEHGGGPVWHYQDSHKNDDDKE